MNCGEKEEGSGDGDGGGTFGVGEELAGEGGGYGAREEGLALFEVQVRPVSAHHM